MLRTPLPECVVCCQLPCQMMLPTPLPEYASVDVALLSGLQPLRTRGYSHLGQGIYPHQLGAAASLGHGPDLYASRHDSVVGVAPWPRSQPYLVQRGHNHFIHGLQQSFMGHGPGLYAPRHESVPGLTLRHPALTCACMVGL